MKTFINRGGKKRICSCLFGQNIVGENSDAGPVRDEVSDRFHDVPRVDPPGEPSQGPALNRQQRHAGPQNPGAVELSCLGQLCLHLNKKKRREK